jgi:hypothetical protein
VLQILFRLSRATGSPLIMNGNQPMVDWRLRPGSILSSFILPQQAVVEGLWKQIPLGQLANRAGRFSAWGRCGRDVDPGFSLRFDRATIAIRLRLEEESGEWRHCQGALEGRWSDDLALMLFHQIQPILRCSGASLSTACLFRRGETRSKSRPISTGC